MQKGFAQPLLILLLITAVIAGGAYFYFRINTKAPLAIVDEEIKEDSINNVDMKSYLRALGFEFKYKSNLLVKEDSEENFNKRGNGDFRKNFTGYIQYEPAKFLGATVVLEKDDNFDTNPFTVWVFENPDNLDIGEWYKNYWYYPFVWGDFTEKQKFEFAPKNEATISGKTAKSGVIDYRPGKPKFIYLSNDKKMYLFRIIGTTGEDLLSTFKFND